jgi:hypothetical protein
MARAALFGIPCTPSATFRFRNAMCPKRVTLKLVFPLAGLDPAQWPRLDAFRPIACNKAL